MGRDAHTRGHLAGLLAARLLLCTLHFLNTGGVQLIRPKEHRRCCLLAGEASGEFGFEGILLPCLAHRWGCSSCSSTCWCHGRKDEPSLSPAVLGSEWNHGTAEKQPFGEGNSRYVQVQGKMSEVLELPEKCTLGPSASEGCLHLKGALNLPWQRFGETQSAVIGTAGCPARQPFSPTANRETRWRGKLPPAPRRAAAAAVCDACPDVSCPAPAGMPGAFNPPEVFQLFARCTQSPDGREAPAQFAQMKNDRIWLRDRGRAG